MMELMKATCLWKMNDEMEWEPIRFWRTVVGHLVGRPWMVQRILRRVHSRMFSSVLESDHSLEL